MGLTGRDEGAETAKALPPGRLARLSWRPALLAGQGNAVRARNWAGRSLALTTSFYGRSSDNSVEVGPGFRTKGLFVKIEGSGNRVVIGRDVTWSGRISLFGHGLTVMIGDRCDAKGVGITAWEASVAIGRDCLLARGIEIRSSDIHRILDRATGERLNPARDVVIGDGVWIAGQAAILRGARVADGCVVGIRAVVTGAFDEPGCVLAGSPARVVRQGVAWAR